SPTQVTGNVRGSLDDTNATTDWDEAAFSDARRWARTALFHSQRLIFAGSRALPDHIWGSKVEAYFNFDVGEGLDAEAIDHESAETQIGAITALMNLGGLQVFSSLSEANIPVSSSNPLTPSNFSIKTQTRFGSPRVQPKII